VGLDHVVDEAAFGRNERIRESIAIFFDERAALGFTAIDYIHRSFGPHNCDFRRRVSEVDVSPQMLGSHYAVGAAVCLARDDSDLRDCRLGIGVK
jgi:hypothetical protein